MFCVSNYQNYRQFSKERRSLTTLKMSAMSNDCELDFLMMGNLDLSKSWETQLKAVIDRLPNYRLPNSYDEIEDSQFKRDFLQNINGKLEDHIPILRYMDNPCYDNELFDDLQSKHQKPSFEQMLAIRSSLPVFKMRSTIILMVQSSQVMLISGETGCGKTTQVPQFILDYFISTRKGSSCKIICTQPRRISAISVAKRVAAERGEILGQSTGYKIRLEEEYPRDRASITFCTTGVILRKMQSDPFLTEYSHIILDEIHERGIEADFLITLLKQVMRKRKDLRIILMSATLNAKSFWSYFGNCPHLNINSYMYSVEKYFLEDVVQKIKFEFLPASKEKLIGPAAEKQEEFDSIIKPYIEELQTKNKYDEQVYKQISNINSEELNIQLIFNLLEYICFKEQDQGAVLIFLPGYSDISQLYKTIVSSCKFPENKFAIIPLHSLISTDEQLKVFNTPPPGVRKIIISTIIAETSITINDVVFVIDCGKVKIKNFNFKLNIETLESVWISKANASQRKGRVGRVKPGKCFHLMTRARYETLEPYMCPEILRSRLENVLLTAKVLQLGKIRDFFSRLMDSPDPGAIAVSLDLLKRLEALDENESLTPLGYHLAKLPMNPQIGKMLLFGAIFNCLQPILNIAIILEYKDPFIIPFGKENEAIWKRHEFGRNCKSDHLFMSKLVLKFQKLNEFKREQFCSKLFLNLQTMTHILKLKKEFMQHLLKMGFVPNLNPKCKECNSNSYSLDVLRAIICAGLYPNIVYIGELENKAALFQLLNDDQVTLHPKSILIGKYIRNPLLVYYKLIKSTNVFIHDATPIDSLHVLFFGDNFQIGSEGEHYFITISNTLKFTSIKSTAEVIKELRDKLNKFLEYKISHPSVVDLREENEETLLLRTIAALLDKKE